MILSYYKGETPNFGDELNSYIWPKILPNDFLDDDGADLLIGIGSILWDSWPSSSIKHVLGSGYGGYTKIPDVTDGQWNIVFVRGPRTAAAIGAGPEKAICDSAIFLKALELPFSGGGEKVSFMPHFESINRGFWPEVCEMCGVNLIDPTGPVETILAAISSSKVLVTEAMHGAIVADILRVPWIAATPIHPVHRLKWSDWGDSLELNIRHQLLRPSSLLEQYVSVTGGRKFYSGRARSLRNNPVFALPNQILRRKAAARLAELVQLEPQLSRDVVIDRAYDRAMVAMEGFVRSRR